MSPVPFIFLIKSKPHSSLRLLIRAITKNNRRFALPFHGFPVKIHLTLLRQTNQMLSSQAGRPARVR